jgi:hypothetical protein
MIPRTTRAAPGFFGQRPRAIGVLMNLRDHLLQVLRGLDPDTLTIEYEMGRVPRDPRS